MAEVLHVLGGRWKVDGRTYWARVCGREADDGRWEGWLEFVATGETRALRTERETVQPNRAALQYWGSGLTSVYVEGALERALEPPHAVMEERPERPAFDSPGPSRLQAPPPDLAVLDPLTVARFRGEIHLRKRLSALDRSHLCVIARAYGFVNEHGIDLGRQPKDALVELIVKGTLHTLSSMTAAR